MMNTRRGIVFETTSSYSIFFTEDGVFEKGIPLSASVEIGEEAFYKPLLNKRSYKATFNSSWTAPVLSMVATLVLLFSILLPSQTPVSAYVQIDINPSVELGLDQEGTVYSFKGLNDDGEALKRDIAFWKGKPLTWVLHQIVDRTETTIKTQEEIEITTIYENKENHAKLEKVIVSAVSNSNSKSMMQKYSVNVNEASLEDRQAANNEGISVQKYKAQFKDNKVEKQQQKIKKKDEKQQEIKKKDENKKHEDNNKLQKENKKESQIPAVDMKDHKNTHNKSKQNPQHQKQESKQVKPNKKWDKPAKSEGKTQSHQPNQQNDSNREGKDNGQSKTSGNHPSEKKTNSDHHDNPRQDKKGKNKDHERKDNDQKRKQDKKQSGKEQSEQGKNRNHKNH
ncbi:hypothetical protein HMPREF1210_01373 [Paenisporosarcina sp. HGH0030]|nr:hypothetical protein HMPREF1210_01373 [Paenisporosarcina sp. HGH0030]